MDPPSPWEPPSPNPSPQVVRTAPLAAEDPSLALVGVAGTLLVAYENRREGREAGACYRLRGGMGGMACRGREGVLWWEGGISV